MARRALEELLDEAALDVASRAYDNLKNHARFAETQRFGFFIAYFAFTGAVGTAILNRLFAAEPLDDRTRWVIAAVLGALIVAGIVVGMAVVKLGVVFSRNYNRAELLLAAFRETVSQNVSVVRVLKSSALPTLGKTKKKAQRFGTAAAYIYLICLLIGIKGAAIALLLAGVSNINIIVSTTYVPITVEIALLVSAVFASSVVLAYKSARKLERFLRSSR